MTFNSNKRRAYSSPSLAALAEEADAEDLAQDHLLETPQRELRRLQVRSWTPRRRAFAHQKV